MTSVPWAKQPCSRFVEANGLSQHYLDWGNPDQPPLLMLHGTSHCAQVWNHLAKALCGDFHVMCFDQRGHGDSDAPGFGYTFDQLGLDLVAIVQQMGINQAYVLAHSSGGFASIMADALKPGVIGRAVLVETRITRRTQGPIGQDRVDRTRQKRTVWESRDALFQAYRSRPAFQSWEKEIFRNFIDGCARLLDDGRVQLKCSPEVEADYYESRDSLDLIRYMEGLQGEYLLLLGDYPGGQTADSEGVRRFLSLVGGAHVKPLGKGTHFLPMEYPELVVNEARQFFL